MSVPSCMPGIMLRSVVSARQRRTFSKRTMITFGAALRRSKSDGMSNHARAPRVRYTCSPQGTAPRNSLCSAPRLTPRLVSRLGALAARVTSAVSPSAAIAPEPHCAPRHATEVGA